MIAIVILIVGVLIWSLVPREILYPVIGGAVILITALSYLVYRKRGIAPFKTLAKKGYNLTKENNQQKEPRPPEVPDLSWEEKERFKEAVGYRCENPNCREPDIVDIHHIIPKSRGGTNMKNNIIVLCPLCHAKADRGQYNRLRVQGWISRPDAKEARDNLTWRY